MPLTALFSGIPECYDLEVFQHLLLQEIKRSLRYSEFFALLLLSVDSPDGEPAKGGGAQGEKLLPLMFDNVRQELRDTDFIGRYGNHLGVVLLHSSAEGTRLAAERVRERIARFMFPSDLTAGRPRMTVSMGGACFPTDGRDLSSLLQRAFLSLRRARETGGDRTVMYDELNGGA